MTIAHAPQTRVFLRPLREEDIGRRYTAWFADPDVTRYLDSRNITRRDAIEHLRRGRETGSYTMYAICIVQDDRHIGNLKIGPVRWQDMVSDLVTVIGDRTAWGKGYAREAIRLGIDLAFREMNIRKLSASIDSLNEASLRAYTAAGFHVETTLKEQFLHRTQDGFVPSDKVYVACFNPNFDPARADSAGR